MKLTDKTCKNTQPRATPYKMADGSGLYLLVNPNGSKYWRMKYRFLGKEKLIAFGTYPLISLAEAREERDKARRLLTKGIDPATTKKDEKRKSIRNTENSFKVVALEWHENQKDRWSTNHADNVIHRLEQDIFPSIGKESIADITAPDLLIALRKIEKRGAQDIASRARQICGQIFCYGIQTGRCTRDPSYDLRGALKQRKTKHFPALESREIPLFLQALEQNDARLFARTRRAIWLSLLTFTRPGELRQARWEEIDFQQKEWLIPAERMKMKRAHIVPLSRQALSILEAQKEETGDLNTPWVFPSQIHPKEPMSNGTVNVAIKKLGYHGRMTAHGFRALARTTIREKLEYDPDVIECQLAHKAAGPLGEAYNRAQFLDKRKKMMQHWADYLDAVASDGKVIVGNFKKGV